MDFLYVMYQEWLCIKWYSVSLRSKFYQKLVAKVKRKENEKNIKIKQQTKCTQHCTEKLYSWMAVYDTRRYCANTKQNFLPANQTFTYRTDMTVEQHFEGLPPRSQQKQFNRCVSPTTFPPVNDFPLFDKLFDGKTKRKE